MQAFYGGDPERWFHMPVWMLLAYQKMLGPLVAGRQLMAIEAALVPHLKPDGAKRITDRHRRALERPEKRKPVAMQLLDGFREAGFKVVHE